MTKETETTQEEYDDLDEDIINRKSKARRDIVKRVREFDPMAFDATPWDDPNVIRPIPGKQEKFLMSRADITFFSGSSGSSKTVALVMDQLQYIHDPKFESVSFRVTTGSLTGAGGLFSTKSNFYTRLGAEKRLADKKYIWPSGATSRYSHLEHGKATAEENHSGLEYSAINYVACCGNAAV